MAGKEPRDATPAVAGDGFGVRELSAVNRIPDELRRMPAPSGQFARPV